MKIIHHTRSAFLMSLACIVFGSTVSQPSAFADTVPRLILQDGANSGISALAVSNGGKWLASTEASDSPLHLWDGREGLLWDRWPVLREPLAFSPDGSKLLVSGNRPSVVEMRAVPSGRLLRTFATARPLFFDGQTIRGVQGGVLSIFEVATGKLKRRVRLSQAPGNAEAESYSLSPNGRYVALGMGRGQYTARMWDADTGKLLRTVKGERNVLGMAAASPDGKYLVTQGENAVWKPPTDGPNTEASYARQLTLKLWSVQTGKLLRTWPGHYSLSGGVRLLRFSNDGTFLLSAGSERVDRWNVATGKLAGNPGSDKDFLRSVDGPYAFSPDAATLAGEGKIYQSGLYAPGLCLVDIYNGKVTRRFPGTLRGSSQVQWSPGGQYLVGGPQLIVWNAKNGHLIAEHVLSNLHRYELRDDQTVQSSRYEAAEIWSIPDGKRLAEIRPVSTKKNSDVLGGYSNGVSLSPNGKWFLTTTPGDDYADKSLYVWDAANQKILRKIENFGNSGNLDEHLWLPDSRRIVRGTSKGMELWNVETGKKEREWRDPVDRRYEGEYSGDALTPVAVSKDGRRLAVHAGRNRVVLIYDLETGQHRSTILTRDGYKARFSPDGDILWILNERGLEAWRVSATQEKIETPAIVLPEARGNGFSFSPHGKLVALASDKSVEIWSVAKKAKVLTIYLLGGDSQKSSRDWIAVTPEGYYDASPAGEARLRWRQGNKFWPVAKSRTQFRRPDLVQQALSDF